MNSRFESFLVTTYTNVPAIMFIPGFTPCCLMLSLFLLCHMPMLARSAIAADEVTSLPGWTGKLPTRHYSGYLPVRNGQAFMHYYLQLSEGDPSVDPITLWMNGGPGCTSVKGAFEELGQLVFNRYSNGTFDPATTAATTINTFRSSNSSTSRGGGGTVGGRGGRGDTGGGVPTLFRNPLSWTRASSMLYFESPPGVGFSYCAECAGNATPSTGCRCAANDTSTALDNLDAVAAFFKAFPELGGRAKQKYFFITGESYAGTYIPMLMDLIDSHNKQNSVPHIPLIGAAIGNGCWGNKVGVCGGDGARIRAEFYYGKGLFSRALKAKLVAACGPFESKTPWDQSGNSACAAALSEMNAEVGPHNFYNLADFCPQAELRDYNLWTRDLDSILPDGGAARMDAGRHKASMLPPLRSLAPYYATNSGGDDVSSTGEPLGSLQRWCGVDRAMFAWLALPEVKRALHVADGARKNTETNNLKYSREGADDLRPLYARLAKTYRLWIYDGMEDGCVPYNGVEDWTGALGFPVEESWRPWFGDTDAGGLRVAAGYVTTYGGGAQDFRFVTVKGAGHEVPTFKPAAAYDMFTRFLAAKPL